GLLIKRHQTTFGVIEISSLTDHLLNPSHVARVEHCEIGFDELNSATLELLLQTSRPNGFSHLFSIDIDQKDRRELAGIEDFIRNVRETARTEHHRWSTFGCASDRSTDLFAQSVEVLPMGCWMCHDNSGADLLHVLRKRVTSSDHGTALLAL